MSGPLHVEASRTYPVSVEHAYDVVAPAPLTTIFRRRYGPLPPVREVRDQTGGAWASSPGQTRTVVTTDRGTMREELLTLDRPHRFGYELTGITGPMAPLVERVEGEWRFEPAGTGTRVTWAWVLHPRSAVAAPAVRLVARWWKGYARQALEEIEPLLVD
jgi:hypothetical protein